ncbi:hypothetical protein INR49_002112 [Caranx melampygus]|nr:hypothetical protein INR49_002112 [Caranx melampygus]
MDQSTSNIQRQNIDVDELERDGVWTWIVEFFANWSPECQSFASVLLISPSSITVLPQIWQSGHRTLWRSLQKVSTVPTLQAASLSGAVQGGKEVMRRPQVDKKGRAVSWSFTEENIIREFTTQRTLPEIQETQ